MDPGCLSAVVTGRGTVYAVADHRSNDDFDPISRRTSATEDVLIPYFDAFLTCPKPIVAGLNGSAFGAGATSATLCDNMVAVPQAEVSFPFRKWHVVPEGCSSVHLARLAGQVAASRLLGGWIPTAVDVGFAVRVAVDVGFDAAGLARRCGA